MRVAIYKYRESDKADQIGSFESDCIDHVVTMQCDNRKLEVTFIGAFKIANGIKYLDSNLKETTTITVELRENDHYYVFND